MTRVSSLVMLIIALLAAPLAVEAQPPHVSRLGVLLQGGAHFPAVDGLRDGLRELGLEEGKQFVLDVRDAKGDLKSVDAAARNLEAEKLDLIYTVSTSVSLAAKRATKRVPIVFYVATNPVTVGLIESFRKPGGRLTGIHSQYTDLTAKRLELLKEMIPGLRRVVTFYSPDNPAAQQAITLARDAARRLKVGAHREASRLGRGVTSRSARPPAWRGGCLFLRVRRDGDQPGGVDRRDREDEEAADHAPGPRECRGGGTGELRGKLLRPADSQPSTSSAFSWAPTPEICRSSSSTGSTSAST
jgi:ABC transporter substrate binding protein